MVISILFFKKHEQRKLATSNSSRNVLYLVLFSMSIPHPVLPSVAHSLNLFGSPNLFLFSLSLSLSLSLCFCSSCSLSFFFIFIFSPSQRPKSRQCVPVFAGGQRATNAVQEVSAWRQSDLAVELARHVDRWSVALQNHVRLCRRRGCHHHPRTVRSL